MKDSEFQSSFPGISAWLLSLVCSCIVVLGLIFIGNTSKSIYKSISYQRLNKKIEELKNPAEILNDSYISLLPEKKIKTMKKTLAIYTTIKKNDYTMTKMIVDDAYYKFNNKKPKLKSHITSLIELSRDDKKERTIGEATTKDLTREKIKEKALSIALSMFKEEILPKTEPLGNSALAGLKNLFS